MHEYNFKELNNKFQEIYDQDPQEMLEYELIHIDEDNLCEMADIDKQQSNLPVIVWANGPRNMKHGFRIKFQNSYSNHDDGSQMIPMTISDNPQIPKSVHTKLKIKERDLEKVKQWVILNKQALLKYAKGECSTYQMFQELKPYVS